MSQRISYYVVFVTIIWGVSTDHADKIRSIFKNNMTRNDFSNLLQSLIKLNEQRVSVLKKLSKLEDYGVLNDVLRSGDNSARGRNLNNLYLVVLSKNQSAQSRKNLEMKVIDTVASLDLGKAFEDNQLPPLHVQTPGIVVNNQIYGNKRNHKKFHIPENDQNVVQSGENNTLSDNIQILGGVQIPSNIPSNIPTFQVEVPKPEHLPVPAEIPEIRSKNHKLKNILRTEKESYNDINNNYRVMFEENVFPTIPNIKNRYKIDDGGHIFTTEHYSELKEDNIHLTPKKAIKHYKEGQEKSVAAPNFPLTKIEEKKSKQMQGRFEVVGNGGKKRPKVSIDRENNYPLMKESDPANLHVVISSENDQITKYLKIKEILFPDENEPNISNEPKIKYGSHENKDDMLPKRIYSNEIDLNNKRPKINKQYSKENKNMKIIKDLGNKISELLKYNSENNNHNLKQPKINEEYFNEYDHENKHPNIVREGSSTKDLDSKNVQDKNKSEVKEEFKKEGKGSSNLNVEINQEIKQSKINEDIENDKVLLNINVDNGNPDSKIGKINAEPRKNKEKSNEHNHDIKYPKETKDLMPDSNHHTKNGKDPNDVRDNSKFQSYLLRDKGNENGDGNKKIDKENLIENVNKNKLFFKDFIGKTRENAHSAKYLNLKKEKPNMNGHSNKHPHIVVENPNDSIKNKKHPKDGKDTTDIKFIKTKLKAHSNEIIFNTKKPKSVNDMSYSDEDNNKPKGIKEIYDEEDYNNYGKGSIEVYGDHDDTHHDEIKEEKDTQEMEPQVSKASLMKDFEATASRTQSRKNFQKCISKKAFKLCTKSCMTAYKNVCRRLKCSSRAKKSLKKECKRSCKKSFSSGRSGKSGKSKYSDEYSDSRS